MSGARAAWTTPLAEHTTLRASGASWVGRDDYAVTLEGTASGACLVGGTVMRAWADSDAWTKRHGRSAIRFSQPHFSVIGVRVANNGDGIKAKDAAGGAAQDFTVAASWIQHIHDDCLENDYLHAGAIRDNLFDGCYVLFSARPWQSGIDAGGNVVTTSDNIAALEPMHSVYSGPSPGTGGFFKWSPRAPGVVLTDNVLAASQAPNHGTLDPPPGLRPQRDRVDGTGCVPVGRGLEVTVSRHGDHHRRRPVHRRPRRLDRRPPRRRLSRPDACWS